MTPTPPTLSPALKQAVKALLLATAYTDTVRPRVIAYQTEILKAGKFPYDPTVLLDGETPPPFITDPAQAWLMSDEDFAVYAAQLDEAKVKAGFENLAPGYCPLLVAENLQMQAEHALFEAAKYITHIDHREIWDMEKRYALRDLLVGLVLSVSPEITPKALLAPLAR